MKIKIFLKVILIVVVILVAGFAGLIAYALVTDYKPAEKDTISSTENPDVLPDSLEISLLTWNIGYCGLDKDMDFFYDGGTKVFTPEKECIKNLKSVREFLKQNVTTDFILLQEVDKKSKRSYNINEYDSISKSLSDYLPLFAKNYAVFFVPVPPLSPMGKVLSGLTTLSKFKPSSSVRYSFPGEYGFPKQLFMLDRCFLINRYPLSNGRELLIINTHNEAFDPGQIRRAQMNYLKEVLLREYEKGNYIITGGDWNQNPPGFQSAFSSNKTDTTQMKIPGDYLPSGWNWLFDNRTPSERNVISAYNPTSTPTTVIDFFLISPNIREVSVEGINLDFENSDHNPVRVKIKLQK